MTRITQRLPQFENNPALFVVLGTFHGILYYAHDGEIEKITELEGDSFDHKDRGDLVTRSGGGQTYGVSSTQRTDKDREYSIETFLAKTQDALGAALKDKNIVHIFIFAPSHMKGRIEKDVFTQKSQALVREYFGGTYTSTTPTELVRKVSTVYDAHKESKKMPPTGDAQKILKKKTS